MKHTSAEKSSKLVIASEGLSVVSKDNTVMVLRYVQYTLDGVLIGAHKVGRSYKKQINIAPGAHHLLVERASRGLLGARAFLDDDGVCYTFSVTDGQTVTFVGKALSEKEWVADGFEDSNYQEKAVEVSRCR